MNGCVGREHGCGNQFICGFLLTDVFMFCPQLFGVEKAVTQIFWGGGGLK